MENGLAMEIKLRKTEGSQVTKTNESSAKEWRVVNSGFAWGHV